MGQSTFHVMHYLKNNLKIANDAFVKVHFLNDAIAILKERKSIHFVDRCFFFSPSIAK